MFYYSRHHFSNDSGRPTGKVLLVFLLVMLCCQSCYQYQIIVPNVSVEDSRTMNRNIKKPVIVKNWLWGFVRTPGYSIRALDCIPPAQDNEPVKPLWLSSTEAKRNFGQTMATVFSLGIYSPSTLSWECASPPGKEGIIKPKPKP